MYSSLSLVCLLLATILVADAGKILVAGGADAAGETWDSVDAFDTENNGVSQISRLPINGEGIAMVTSGGRIFAMGGELDGVTSGIRSNQTLVYDSNRGNWKNYNELPKAGAGTAVSINDTILFAVPDIPVEFVNHSSLYLMQKNSKTWNKGPHTLYDHLGTEGVAFNGSFYMCGGYAAYSPAYVSSNLCERYDVTARKWFPVPHMLNNRSYCAMIALDNHIYVTGGQTTESGTSNERFNPTTGIWSPISAMNQPREAHAVASDGRYIYALGGAGNEILDTIEIYDPKTDKWELANSRLSRVRDHVSAVYVENL